MSAETIIQKINEKAISEAEAIRRSGEEKAAAAAKKLLEGGEKDAEIIRTAAGNEADEIRHREHLKTEMEARQNTLSAKRGLIDRAFDEAMDRLCSLEGGDWSALMTRLVLEECMPGKVSLCVTAKDAEKLREPALLDKLKNGSGLLEKWSKALAEKHGVPCELSLDSEAASFRGGILFKGENCDLDASFEMLLRDVRERYEYEISLSLFSPEGRNNE